MNAAMTLVSTVRDAIFERRSVRDYTGTKPETLVIQQLLAAAVRAPTAVHTEPWRFLIIQDAATLTRISDRAKALFAEQARQLHLHEDSKGLSAFARPEFNVFYNAGTLVVICAGKANPFAVADCWLAAENLMLAAHSIGLGCCVIGSAVAALNAPDLKAELGIPEDQMAVAPIIVGIPAGDTAPTPRKAPQVLAWR